MDSFRTEAENLNLTPKLEDIKIFLPLISVVKFKRIIKMNERTTGPTLVIWGII